MNNNISSKQIIISILGVIILIVAVIGISFAAFTYSQAGTKVNTITIGKITMNYTEATNGITLNDALPMTDDTGKTLTGSGNTFDFTVNANIQGSGTTTINYLITITEVTTTFANTGIKVYLTSNNDATVELTPTKVSELPTTQSNNTAGAPTGQRILKTGTVTVTNTTVDQTTKYRLRMWVADDFSDSSKSGTYAIKVNVYGKANAQ